MWTNTLWLWIAFLAALVAAKAPGGLIFEITDTHCNNQPNFIEWTVCEHLKQAPNVFLLNFAFVPQVDIPCEVEFSITAQRAGGRFKLRMLVMRFNPCARQQNVLPNPLLRNLLQQLESHYNFPKKGNLKAKQLYWVSNFTATKETIPRRIIISDVNFTLYCDFMQNDKALARLSVSGTIIN